MDSASSPWSVWLAANGPRFLLFARSQTRCEADAQDLLQEALVEAWRRGDGRRPPDDALVYATLKRRAIDLARRDDRRVRREQVSPTAWFEPAGDGVGEIDRDLAGAVQNLPEPLREVVAMKIWSELTFAQIGGALGISPNTAASRYRYAIDRLREAFREEARR